MALRDQAAHVRFSLPHQVAAEPKSIQDPNIKAVRLYQDTIGEVELSVTVLQTGVDIPAGYPRSVYEQMASALNRQGATNARLSSVKEAKAAKGDALDATLSFTATDGTRNYWRLRTITAGHTMVQLQVLTFSDPADAQAPKKVDAMFAHLVDSVVLD